MTETITIRSIWGGMSDEAAASVLGDVKRESPEMYREAVNAAAGSLKLRPQVLRQQPVPRQAATIRRALTQVNQQDLGAHLLIEWLTKCQKPMLSQFLDDLGISHEDGTVKEDVGAEPDVARLSAAIDHLSENFPPEHVHIYLSAFSVITADDWEKLPDLIG